MIETRWRTTLSEMPYAVTRAETGGFYHPRDGYRFNPATLLGTERDAVSHARKLRIAEIDRLQVEVNALDARYDTLDDEEMAVCLQQRMAETDHLKTPAEIRAEAE